MRVYTRTGDSGETGLIGQARVPKTDLRIEAIGCIDEVNAFLGQCRVDCRTEETQILLEWLQNRLFDVGAELACEPGGDVLMTSVGPGDIEQLERSMDIMTAELEPLKQFVLPGGSSSGTSLHIARTVCRRAERRIFELHAAAPVSADILRFVNRLSDWLFVAARHANMVSGVPDVVWTRKEVPQS